MRVQIPVSQTVPSAIAIQDGHGLGGYAVSWNRAGDTVLRIDRVFDHRSEEKTDALVDAALRRAGAGISSNRLLAR